jgi:hypothetical protein
MKKKITPFLNSGKNNLLKHSLFLFAFVLSQNFYSQQSYTFTNASATGSLGPTQTQVNTAYASTNLSGSVIVTGGVQSFTIQQAGNYKIEAWGAAGGTQLYSPGYPGGTGAYLSGNFTFTAGTVLKILVGHKGGDTQGTPVDNAAPGGGGGTFVYFNATDLLPLMAAGGGAGGGRDPGLFAATTASNGNAALVGGAGGSSGNGGQQNTTGSSYWAGGGSGWLTDGTGGNNATNYSFTQGSFGAYGGRTPANGASGGIRYNDGTDEGGDGGFGGGGGGGSDNMGTGGGGGFSGGGGARSGGNGNPTGGGGGSYNGGTSQINTASVNIGHGKVVITELCNITLVASGTNSNSAICSGNSVTLTTNAISNYSWSTGATTSSIIVSPTTTTVYNLTATSPSLCTTSSAILITVNGSIPSLTVVNTASASSGICPSRTVALTASGATSYSWTGGSTTVTNGVVFSPTISSGYIVTGFNACGTSTAATSVSIHPLPAVTAVASTASLCSGTNLTLTGVGSATAYAWSGGPLPITNGVGFQPSSTITYSVIGTSALSCTALSTVPVTVVTTPIIPPIASPPLVCIGNSSTLSATGASSYTWTSSTGVISNGATAIITPTAALNTYTITKSNSNCVDTKTISVIVNQLPFVFAIVTPTIICSSAQATLAAGGAQSYTWTTTGPPTLTLIGASPVISPAVSSTYTVAASDGTCVNTTTVFIATNPNPTIGIVASGSVICQNQSVTMTANGGINYTWTAAPSFTSNSVSITATPTAPILYNVTGDNSFGCTSSNSQIVLVNANPVFTPVASKTLVCVAGPSTLTAGPTNNTYTWLPGSVNSRTIIVNPTGTAIYTVIGTSTVNLCQTTKTVQVGVFIPSITVTSPTNTCFGGNITLVASGANSGSYNWNTGSGFNNPFPSIAVTPTVLTVYTVSAVSTLSFVNCPSTQTTSIGIFYNPTITAVAQRTFFCRGESLDLIGQGGVSYAWSNSATGTTITVNPTINTTYTVTGTDANGCVNTGTILVKVSGCTGIEESAMSSMQLAVYPNPNNGEFVIQSNSAIDLKLINELGQIVRVISLSGTNNHQVNVTDLAKGIYFVVGDTTHSTIRQKIVVAK